MSEESHANHRIIETRFIRFASDLCFVSTLYHQDLDHYMGRYCGGSSLSPLEHLHPLPNILLGHNRIPFVQQYKPLNSREGYLDVRLGEDIGELLRCFTDIEFLT